MPSHCVHVCGQMLASASGPHGLSVSQICIWDLEQMALKHTLTHHQFDIVCLTYARDDRFLISVGRCESFIVKHSQLNVKFEVLERMAAYVF